MEPLSPDLSLEILNKSVFNFSWKPSKGAINCSSLYYGINTSNCGICLNKTKDVFISCSNVKNDGQVCVFSVYSEVCGYHMNDDITLTILKRGNLKVTLLYYSFTYFYWSHNTIIFLKHHHPQKQFI